MLGIHATPLNNVSSTALFSNPIQNSVSFANSLNPALIDSHRNPLFNPQLTPGDVAKNLTLQNIKKVFFGPPLNNKSRSDKYFWGPLTYALNAIGINTAPESATPETKTSRKVDITIKDDTNTSLGVATTNYLKYEIQNGEINRYIRVVWDIGAVYNTTISNNGDIAACIINSLDGVTGGCQSNLSPGIHDELVQTPCENSYPVEIIATTCYGESAENHTSFNTTLFPGFVLRHSISLADSSTSFGPSAAMMFDIWKELPVALTPLCIDQLTASFHRHLWCRLQNCFHKFPDAFSGCSNNPKTFGRNPPLMPGPHNRLAIPTEIVNNTLNMYFLETRLVDNTPTWHSPSQWTIRVITNSSKTATIGQCIIKTLDNRTGACNIYQKDKSVKFTVNCEEDNEASFIDECRQYFSAGLQQQPQTAYTTSLSPGITLEHTLRKAIMGHTPFSSHPPLYWPHSELGYIAHEPSKYDTVYRLGLSPKCIKTIDDVFKRKILCIIAHCYPNTRDARALFLNCSVSNLSPRPTDEQEEAFFTTLNTNKTVVFYFGVISITIVIVKRIKNSYFKEKEIPQKSEV